MTVKSSLYDLKNELCHHWSQLTPDSIEISYLLENKLTFVDTNSDLQSAICFQLYKKSAFFSFTIKRKDCHLQNIDTSSHSTASEVSSNASLCSTIVVHGKSYLKDMMKRGSNLSISDFKGFCFGSAIDFRGLLMAYQIQTGYELIFLKNTSSRITVVCSSFSSTGCQFKVHATCDSTQLNRFFIRNLVSEHSCGGGLKNLSNPNISSSFIKLLIIDEIRDHPSKKPKDIIDDFRREYNIELNYPVVYSAKKLALAELYGNDAMSYDDLRWYLEALQHHNPGSYVDLEVNASTNQFERVFIALSACIRGFEYCRPMIFLDATHLKGRPGVLMGATTKNGNQGIFCFVLCVQVFLFSYILVLGDM